MPLTDFQPAWWLPGGHLQTLSAAYWRGPQRVETGIARRIDLADGDALVALDDCPPAWRAGDPVILMMHGLGGCARNAFLVRTSAKLNAAGVRVFRLNLRGCGAGSGLCRWPYNAGRSEDLQVAIDAVVEWCRAKATIGSDAPVSPLTLFGMSLSGNILLKYLGEAGNTVPASVRAALAVNPPIDLARSVRTLDRPLNRGYDRHFTKALIEHVQRQTALRPDFAPLPKRLPGTLYEFDDQYTAPHGGFANAEEYYLAASARSQLSGIRVPTTILTAEDDPLVPVGMFREQEQRFPATVRLVIAAGGGHLGYVGQRRGDPDPRWLDWRVVEFTREHASDPPDGSA